MYSKIFQDAGLIYNSMADEESRDIFRNRVLFSVTKDWKYAKNIVGKYLRGYSSDKIFIGMEENLKGMHLDTEGKFIIYGAGMFGGQVFHILQREGLEVIAFCDMDGKKQGQKYCELDVITPSQLFNYPDAIILLAVWNQSANIKKDLIDLGIKNEQIADCFLIDNYVDKNQYFDNEIIKFREQEVFLDCGCYDFETSLTFLQKCSSYRKIVCFEPNEDNRRKILQKIEQLSKDNIELLPYGVWNERDTLYFEGSGSSVMVSDEGKQKVEVVSIDEVIKDKVTFIKMDIEGSEMRALLGAAKTIVENRPRLAISVYHKPEDIIEIPAYILSLVPEYKLYLRHYSNYFATETVLYAI